MRPVRLIVPALAAGLALGACGDSGGPEIVEPPESPAAATTREPSPSPTATSFEEELFAITLPAGWSRTGEEPGNPAAFSYQGPDGLFFRVFVFPEENPAYSEFAADVAWRVRLNAAENGFALVRKEEPCTPGPELPESCPRGNGSLEVYVLGEENRFVRGHEFQFEFGSTRSETGVDTDVFEDIIESFVIR